VIAENSPSFPNKIQRIIKWILISFAVLIVSDALIVHYAGYALLPLLKALGLGMVCLIYGLLIQVYFKHKRILLEVSFSIGLIVTTFYFFILGFFHQLTPLWFYAYILIAIAAGIFILLKKGTAPVLELFANKFSYGYLIFLFPLFYAALPSSFFDTLVYHLGIPNLYIQNGGFCATPQFLYANTSIYYEISLIPAVFAGDLVPRFFHLIVGIVLMLTVINFGRDFLGIRKRWLLAVLMVTMPLSGFLLTTVKNDLPGALFILLGIGFLLEKRYAGAGVFWGFAVGIKYFNALPISIFFLLFVLFQKKFPIKKYLLLSLTFLTALLPMVAKNILYSGNPVFPFLYSLFPSLYWDESRFRMMGRDVGRICKSLKDFIRLPYDLSFKEFGSGGRVGVQFLTILPFILLSRKGASAAAGRWQKKNTLLFTFSLLTIFAGCAFTGSIRFFYLPFLLLCVFVVWVYEQKPKGFMRVLVIIVLLLNSASAVSLLNYLYKPHLLYTQRINREQYTAMNFAAYPAVKFLNYHTPEKSKILLVGETRNYYLKRPYRVSSAIDYCILKPYLEKADNFVELSNLLRADGIDYILVNFPEFERLNRQYDRLAISYHQMALAFFKRLEPVFQENGIVVFRVG
jgi:hypothetical protein